MSDDPGAPAPTTGPASAPVVVVGHDASRTGAPEVLRSLLAWVRTAQPGRSVELVLVRGGPLRADLARIVPTRVLGRSARAADLLAGLAARGGRTGTGATAVERALRRRAGLAGGDAAVVVANTLAAAGPAVLAASPEQRVVVHVHELDGVAARVLPPGPARDRVVARTDRWVATGPAVADMLVGRWGLDPRLVEEVPAFVDDPRPVVDAGAVASARRALLGVEGDGPPVPLVVGAGASGPRKGSDRFVDLVATVSGAGVPLGAAWVGAEPGSSATGELRGEVDAAGLAATCRVLPPVGDARPHLAAADLHVTVAREDPFPLTVLEAAALGTAVVGTHAGGFGHLARAAGVPEVAVPVHDTPALARLAAGVLSDPARRAELAASLGGHVRRRHLTPVVAPVLWDVCTRWP